MTLSPYFANVHWRPNSRRKTGKRGYKGFSGPGNLKKGSTVISSRFRGSAKMSEEYKTQH